METKWHVMTNVFLGENKKLYIVGRVRDVNQPVHSGNLEYHGEYMECKDTAQDIADRLNKGVS